MQRSSGALLKGARQVGTFNTYWYYDFPAFVPPRWSYTQTMANALPPDLVGLASTKALLRIKEQKVNLSVSLAELGKTTDMVANFARSTYGFLRSLRRGDLRKTIRSIKKPRSRADKDLASKWLQYQYGWVPLAYEVYGLSELIHQRVLNNYIHVTGKASKTYELNLDSGSNSGLYRYMESVKVHCRYKVDSTSLRTLSQSGISNPALVVWELIPYSFVVDWFVGIGDYLSTLDALVGVTNLQWYKSGKQDAWCDKATYWKLGRGADSIQYYTRSTTTTRSTLQQGGLKPYRPVYNPSLSVARMVSSLALIRNLFK